MSSACRQASLRCPSAANTALGRRVLATQIHDDNPPGHNNVPTAKVHQSIVMRINDLAQRCVYITMKVLVNRDKGVMIHQRDHDTISNSLERLTLASIRE